MGRCPEVELTSELEALLSNGLGMFQEANRS